MQLIFFSDADCQLCLKYKKQFEKLFAEEIENDEAIVLTMNDDEEAYEYWATHSLPLAPTMIVSADNGKLIDVWDAEELAKFLKEAEEEAKADAEAEKKEAAKVPVDTAK
jgi:peroxiredoxin